MLQKGKFFFLSRPRRFGKSLLISTLRNIFEGRRELFKDLWIEKNSKWKWSNHPVVIFDFNGITIDSTEHLKMSLNDRLDDVANQYGVVLKKRLLKDRFKELILNLKEKTGKGVVILVDEYDKPIIEHLGKGKERLSASMGNRDVLRDFFGIVKETDAAPNLNFVFFTGVSKFSKVSVFSELNNLDDLTMHTDFTSLLGWTEEEITSHFKDRLTMLADKQNLTVEAALEGLKDNYNGYRFSDSTIRVYNPFSILKCLDEKAFKNFWFETGTPGFLLNLIKERNFNIPELEKLRVDVETFSTYEIEDIKIEAILFQTGYLTILKTDYPCFTLGYPNREVRLSFLNHLLRHISEIKSEAERSRFLLLSKYLHTENYEEFFATATSLFAAVPYTLSRKTDEGYFHTLFYLMLFASGLETHNEVITCRGRINMAIIYADKIFIIEFKCNQSADTAIDQIKEKGYFEKYLITGKEIFLMGINFNTSHRNITDWKVEKFRNEY